MTSHRPEIEIDSANPWYTDDQFATQWRNPASRAIILNRWRVWKSFIAKWREDNIASRTGNPIRVLDAGCGDGINLIGLRDILGEEGLSFSLYGLDYNPLRIKRADEHLPGVVGLLGNVTELPFKDGSFDLILCNHVLEHIHNDVVAMKVLRRVLSPHGILIIGVPNEGCAIARLRNHLIQPSISKTTDHVQFYTWPVFEKRLHAAGLKAVALEREGFFLPHLLLNRIVGSVPVGRCILNLLRKSFPGGCAGLIVWCEREE